MEIPLSEVVFQNPLLIRNILLQTNYETILNWCRTHQAAQEICRDRVFWEQKAQQDLGIPPATFRTASLTSLSPAQRYLQLLTEKGGVASGSERFISRDEFVRRAIQEKRYDLLQQAIDRGFNNWPMLLREYALMGDINQVANLVSVPERYLIIASAALERGNIPLFESVWPQISIYGQNNARLLLAAVRSGRIDIYEYIRTLIPITDNNLYQILMEEALEFGYLDLFKHISENLPPYIPVNINDLLASAYASQDPNIIQYIQKLIPEGTHIVWNNLLLMVVRVGNIQLFNQILKLAPKNYVWNWNRLAEESIDDNQLNMFNHILSVAPSKYKWDWQRLLEAASRSGAPFTFETICELAPDDLQYDWGDIVEFASRTGDKNFAEYVMSHIPIE